MPKIRVDGVTLHYWQSGEGPDVVLVHGLGGNLAGWHLTMVPELQRSYRVTTYDLRGHGRSDAPARGYTTADMSDDLAGLMQGLNIPHAKVVGHSWGADIALHFALEHPARVSDLVLIEAALLAPLADEYRSPEWEGWPYVNATLEELTGAALPPEKRHDLEYMVRLLMEIPVLYGPAQGRVRDEEVISRVLEIVMPMWHGSRAGRELTLEAIERLRMPAMAVYEANSVCLNALEELRDRMPQLSVAVLPGGKVKHFTGLEHPELILERLKAFWQGQPSGSNLEGAPTGAASS